ncbi:MAG: tRNA lysidine(34) synthetase TilS [Candidatus Pelagibacter sp. TMED106]|nr:MAG: tRNA lysidine(34) synthetase TilS [Candidatus Pelagibacter sp. TMED106]|tara:strand:- start:8385 stop:9422 length:1038 start_codon:yes stop_codon:yes gene_type:complete
MNQKSLSVKNRVHRQILSHLKNKKILQIFKKFEKSLNNNSKFAVAVSGGPDSLSLAFLAKCFALKNKLTVKYFIVDHGLRKNSKKEAETVVRVLKKVNISCKILKWNGKKPSSNIQSMARQKRYSLLINECKKNRIQNILLGHHLDDLFENFFLRILRGSGLNGIISLDKKNLNRNQNISILRPLLDLEKKDLIYLSKEVFNFFVKDPSNKNEDFKRVRIRNLLDNLGDEGLDKKKFLLTINNLKDSDNSIKFYVNRNIEINSNFLKKNTLILSKSFFDQSNEVIFRSLTKVIQTIGQKYYPVRGKSITLLMKKIKSSPILKLTLGGCFIEKINESVVLSKESNN